MATSNMGVSQQVDVTSNPSENIATTAVITLQPRETFVFVWLTTNAENISNITKSRGIINYLTIFNDLDACVEYITDHRQEKVFVIVSSLVGEQILARMNQMDEIDSIYVHSPNEAEWDTLRTQYRKVRGVFINIDSICEQLQKVTRHCSTDRISMSSIPPATGHENGVSREQVSFMYSQLIRELFLVLEHPKDQPHHALREMILHGTARYEGNVPQKALLDELERDYGSMLSGEVDVVPRCKSIWWYTRCPFVYQILNEALRTQDIDMLLEMRFFIVDIHKQLLELSSSASAVSPTTVYRGQAISSEELTKHRSNMGGLLSVDTFWSTSTDKKTAASFASASADDPGMEKVLFEIEIDSKSDKKCPFANISSVSYFGDESEVLISMGSVYRIRSVEKDINDYWEVCLRLTDEEDEQSEALANSTWEKIRSDHDLLSLAKLMRLMGNHEKAEMFIDILMSETLFCRYLKNLAVVINEIGLVYEEKRDLPEATRYYEKFIEMKQKRQFSWSNYIILPVDVTTKTILDYLEEKKTNSNRELSTLTESFRNEQNKDQPDREKLAICCRNMGEIYEEQNNDTVALGMYEKSLKLFPFSDSLNLRTTSIIALLHAKVGNTQASEKCIKEILDERLHFRPHRQEIVNSYERIGFIYEIQQRYDDAVKMYEKILAYPSDMNPNWGIVLPNIGHVYEKQSKYSASLKTFKRLLRIQRDMLYQNHPLMADTYASIAHSLESQHKYEDAYRNLKRALEIDLINMNSNHPWIKKRQTEVEMIRRKMVVKSDSTSISTANLWHDSRSCKVLALGRRSDVKIQIRLAGSRNEPICIRCDIFL